MKWVLLAVGAVVLAIVGFLLRGMFVRETSDGKEEVLPEVESRVRERVEVAEEEAMVARIEAKVVAETERVELKEIAEVDDGAERRRRLAAMMRGM